ncbi:MAG: trypsin-like peptidase domain-containing protein [bacterium]|nr:trypsin-like peptidase domain-containing protein [bacterium]
MINKKIAIYIIAAALAGGAIGSIYSGSSANAFNLRDFLNSFIPSLSAPAPTSSTSAPVAYVPPVDYEDRIIKAVQASEPAVVSVVISKDVPIIENCPADPFSNLPPEFRQFFGDNGGITVPCQRGLERREVGGGSGFIIESDGTIVTNKHVVSDTKASYTVFLDNGKKYDATVIARDPILDFAVIKIKATNLPVLALGDSDALKLGQTAIAIGNVLGEFRNTVSTGVISGLRRNVTATGGAGQSSETIEGVIQTDTAINPGNSGGPLLNLRGEVIGINTAIATNAENVGFAIPINQVKRAITSIKQTGRILTPYMGVRYVAITEEMAKKEKLDVTSGALLRGNEDGPAILKGSPAAKAGLQAEDIVLEVNGDKISDTSSLGALIQKYSVNDTIALKILRGKEAKTIQVTLEERKP